MYLYGRIEDTLTSLKEAGIKVWMLTGDKMETAISIGHSSGLLTDNDLNFVQGRTEQEVSSCIKALEL